MTSTNSILLSALVVLNLVDAASTAYLLRNKVGAEANPVVRFAIEHIGLFPGLTIPKGLMLLMVYVFLGTNVKALTVLCAVYVIVVLNNIGVFLKGKRIGQ